MTTDEARSEPVDDPAAGAIDLFETPIHLGLGAKATPLAGFDWSPEYLAAYERRFAGDGREGRLVALYRNAESWPSWERHPAGEEVVVVLSGTLDLIQRIDGTERRIPLGAGQAAVNPTGVWHTADVHEPGDALFITPGQGTENQPR
jgi:mannose-6-phosphate isomerase-like protein (cupin superfamily)